MTLETSEVMGEWIAPLPLKSNDNIVCGNALRMDWNDILLAEQCDFIIGNPPFIGKKEQTKLQKQELKDVFHGAKVGNLDYVCCWYQKAAEYMADTAAAAFVSTNSISQGEQPSLLWPSLFRENISIKFCWKTFIWDSEATEKAHVHVVIIGFSKGESTETATEKTIFKKDGTVETVSEINPYLIAAPTVLVGSKSKPLSNVPKIDYGSMPIDDGHLILSEDEKNEILKESPDAADLIRQYIGGNELLNNKMRWCLWITDDYYKKFPLVNERVEACKEFRENSDRPQTKKAANKPFAFGEIRQPQTTMLVIPKVSSERREYIPIGFIKPEIIVNGSALIMPDADIYSFGVLSSSTHNAWMRVVAGRMKSDYQYSGKIVYNNFVWPDLSEAQKRTIEKCAQEVLEVRDNYPNWSFEAALNNENGKATIQKETTPKSTGIKVKVKRVNKQ